MSRKLWNPALALGHLGFSSLWGLSRKEGPPVSSPQFSAQMERGTMCWRNFKEVCVWERPESLEAPWIEREAFFLMWFHGPSWKEWQGLPCHSHFKISHAEPTCCLGKLFLSELVLRWFAAQLYMNMHGTVQIVIQLIISMSAIAVSLMLSFFKYKAILHSFLVASLIVAKWVEGPLM